jgi:PII-like signaling protein
MTMLRGPARRLTIIVGETDAVGHRPLYTEIVHRAHEAGLSGASVFRGVEGFGAGGRVHTTRLLDLAEDLPVSVVIVDTADKITGFLPRVEEIVGDGLVLVEDVEVVRSAGQETR